MPSDSELHKCAKDGDTESIKDLLSTGAEVDKPGAQGRTALHRALGGGFVESAQALLEGGAGPTVCDTVKRTCLHCACLAPDSALALRCVELLFEKDEESMAELINNQTKSGTTALHCALSKASVDLIRYLFEHGADPNLKDDDGKTCHDLAKEAKLPKDLFTSTGGAGRKSSAVAPKKSGGLFGKMRRGTKGGDEVKL